MSAAGRGYISHRLDMDTKQLRLSTSISTSLLIAIAAVIGFASLTLIEAPDAAAAAADDGAAIGPAALRTSASGGSQPAGDSPSGGIVPGTPPPAKAKPRTQTKKSKRRSKRRVSKAPVLTDFRLVSDQLFDHGRPLQIRYRITARTRKVRVRLLVRTAGGKYVRTVRLGLHSAKRLQRTSLSQEQLGLPGVGHFKLRIIASDRNGRRAARASRVQAWQTFTFSDHRFPLVGQFSWGNEGSRFGAGRPGHIHQGQDLSAAAGTPIVAPFGGRISWVKYQAAGAGWYVVLDADDGNDYVFMHIKAGTIEVKPNDVVPTGKLLARVGSTGASSGPHLHFEIWSGGPWQFGGKPVDPRPTLESWYRSAPGGALAIGG